MSMVLIVAIELIVPSREAPDGVSVMAIGLNVPSKEAPDVFIFMSDGVLVMAIRSWYSFREGRKKIPCPR